jgi:hypothetical protein
MTNRLPSYSPHLEASQKRDIVDQFMVGGKVIGIRNAVIAVLPRSFLRKARS